MILAVGFPLLTYNQLPFSTIILVMLTLALPPLVAGLLFLAVDWQKSRKSEAS
jgi:hypothetical protein